MGLRDPRQEEVAVRVGAGAEEIVEAVRAVYTPKRGKKTVPAAEIAAMLAEEPTFRERVREVQEARLRALHDRTVMNETWLLEKAREALEGSLLKGQFSAAKGILEMLGQHPALGGLFSKKIEHHHKHDVLQGMSWEDQLALARKYGIVPAGELAPPEAAPDESAEAEEPHGVVIDVDFETRGPAQ